MAEQLFRENRGGKTLHQLRHSRLTHLGDENASTPLLMVGTNRQGTFTPGEHHEAHQARCNTTSPCAGCQCVHIRAQCIRVIGLS
jgi:hypothetical protein